MRKTLLIATAGLALAFAAPLSASAAPVAQGGVLKLIADHVSGAQTVAWHCRWRSGWCGGGWHRRWRSRRGWW
jgi:hypothetical protein